MPKPSAESAHEASQLPTAVTARGRGHTIDPVRKEEKKEKTGERLTAPDTMMWVSAARKNCRRLGLVVVSHARARASDSARSDGGVLKPFNEYYVTYTFFFCCILLSRRTDGELSVGRTWDANTPP